jgi:hexosaminidase
VVSVADPSEDVPQQGTNESYVLVVPGGGAAATLAAATVYGALRGLETFSQLVLFNFSSATYSVAGVPLTVVDEPRFTHRGFMVDTSRHYQTLQMLYRLLESMAYAKLNVLHWHVVDDQSFPLEVRSFPRLQGMGAFSARERYTQLDVVDVVEYARLRGIRVMLEIDTPSHTACWCRGYPEVCPPKPCKDGMTRTPLDPSTNTTFNMIQTILAEVAPLFPETLLHVGQDEVDVGCWSAEQNPTIGAWQKRHGFQTPDEAYVYTANRIEAGVRSLATPKRPVQWWPGLCLGAANQPWISPCRGVINGDGSQPTPGLDKSTVLQLWNHPNQSSWNDTLPQVVAAGFAVIQTQGWYLNAEYLPVPWTQFYADEPMAGVTKPSEQQLILGGEAAAWGEMIDGSALLNTVWPRTAATAERLWSPRHVNDVAAAKQRLAKFRCLLLERGIPAGPLDFKSKAGQPPAGPGSCDAQ